MPELNHIYAMELGKRTVLVDQEDDICISVNTEYYKAHESADSHDIDKIFERERKLRKKIVPNVNTVYLFVTNKCNLACEFCSMRSNKKEQIITSNLTLESLVNNIMPAINEIRPRRIIISGGEPFTHSEILDLIDYISSNAEAQIIIQSNGVLLNNGIISGLAGKVGRLEISTAHFGGDSKKLVDLIQSIKSVGIEITLSFVYNNNNEELFHMLDISKNYNTEFLLSFVSPTGSALDGNIAIMSSEEKLNVYMLIAKYIIQKEYTDTKLSRIFFRTVRVQKACSALGKALSIYPDGNIYICHSLANDEFCAGNINTDNIESVLDDWNVLVNKSGSKELFCVENKKYCKNCKFKYLCGGVCGADIYNAVKMDCMFQKVILIYSLLFYNPSLSNAQNINAFVQFCEAKQYQNYLE